MWCWWGQHTWWRGHGAERRRHVGIHTTSTSTTASAATGTTTATARIITIAAILTVASFGFLGQCPGYLQLHSLDLQSAVQSCSCPFCCVPLRELDEGHCTLEHHSYLLQLPVTVKAIPEILPNK